MTTTELAFGESEAHAYEAWFKTSEGRRADAQEKALLGRLLAGFGPPGTLLEVGCGTGHFLRRFGELGWDTGGVDISRPMLDEARRSPERPAGGLLLSDGAALPFAAGSWDVVAVITMLEFVPDPSRVLREALRVARRGVLLGVLNRWSWLALQRRIQSWFGPTPYDAARFFSAAEIRRLLADTAESAAGGWRLQVETGSALGPRGWPVLGAFLGARAIKVRPEGR
jgi:ubiquinone/menaquinone biosynthesis C-methylase UbiE